MSTKVEQFAAKIRNVKDYQNRILYNIAPLPTGIDISNTLKYFIHTLRNILKEGPGDVDILVDEPKFGTARKRVNLRIPHYPSLDYLGLYETLVGLVDIVPLVQYGQFAFGQAILQLFGCILWFLEPETIDTIPHTVASTLAVFQSSLQKETVDLLCTTLLPICLTEVMGWEGETYATMSMSAVIMLVLQHCKNKAHHALLVECIMTYKPEVFKDILCTIAFGPSTARGAAANLLFHYWPALVPSSMDNREFTYACWKPILCQRSNCLTPVNNAAVKMCMDPSISGKHSKQPPPLYLCSVCSEYVSRELTKPMQNVLTPLENVSRTCENKNCASHDKTALYTCFASECTGQHGNKPVCYCLCCHHAIHPRDSEHVIQEFPHDPWSCDKETQIVLVEAIISLLKEAHVIEKDPLMAAAEVDEPESADEFSQAPRENDMSELESTEEDSRLLSRYGLWLLIEKCTPNDRTPCEIVGRLLSMLFQWYGFTATLTQESIVLEGLKKDYVTNWLLKLLNTNFSVFVSCLMPTPADYAKVGGHWDTLCSRITELHDGLKNVFALTPYNTITFEVWDHIMPAWMESISQEITEEDLPQLQDILCKLFDIDMCPLPFSSDKMFHFIAIKFKSSQAKEQEKALLWLQVLSEMDIVIPIKLLLSIFNEGLASIMDIQRAKVAMFTNKQSLSPDSAATVVVGPNLGSSKDSSKVKEKEESGRPTQVIKFFSDTLMPSSPITMNKGNGVMKITEPFKPPDALKPTEIPKPNETPKKVEPLKPSVLSTPKTLPLELPTNGGGGTLPAEPPHVTIDPSPLSPDQDEKAKMEQTEEEVLRCFVLMLDLLIMQSDLQYLPFHQGLEHSQSKDFVALLTTMLQTPWVTENMFETNSAEGKEKKEEKQKAAEAKHESDCANAGKYRKKSIGHKCTANYEAMGTNGVKMMSCSLCELWALWFQLSLKLLERIAPGGETKVCDMPDVSEYQFEKSLEEALTICKTNDVKSKKNKSIMDRGMSKHKRITKGLTVPENKTDSTAQGLLAATEVRHEVLKAETVQAFSAVSNLKAEKERAAKKPGGLKPQKGDKGKPGKKDQDKSTWHTGHGDFTIKLEELPRSLQLLFMLLQEVSKHPDPNVLLNLLNCVKVLCLNAECLRQAAKDQVGFLVYAQENLLIPSFWNLLEGELSHVVELLVPLILHCFALPCGADVMWRLVDNEVESESWQTRFRAAERVTVMLRCVEKKSLGNNTVIMGSLAHAFSSLVVATEDICPAVSARAILMIESIPMKVIKVLVGCLEFQWDSVLEDRVLILSKLRLLHHYMPVAPVLSWEFFMNRLDTLALEAQVDMEQNKEFPFPMDTSRSSAGLGDRTDIFMNKLNRARLARSQSELSGTLKPRRLSAAFSKQDSKARSKSMPTGIGFARFNFPPSDRSTYSRPANCRGDNFLIGDGLLVNSLFHDGHLKGIKEELKEEIPTFNIDLTNADKQTVHKLITLLMIFMTGPTSMDDDQVSGRAMNTVLRHLTVLLGYNQVSKTFNLPPHQLRESAVFYAFMAGLPKMLDHNVKVGNMVLPMVLSLLQYCPSPQKSSQDSHPPDYTLWFLEPHCRHSWFMSLLIVLYKYSIDQAELKTTLKALVRITMNVLESQRHICKPKRPEPPQPEDIWGATMPNKNKSESSLPREDDISEELGSISSVGPNTPLLTSTTTTTTAIKTTEPSSPPGDTPSSPTPRVEFITPGQVITTISSGGGGGRGTGGGVAVPKEDPRVPQHQELELEPEMLFVSEDEVINLPVNSSSRNFVASTILEVEEEEEPEPELEVVEDFEMIQPLQTLDSVVEPIKATATFVAEEPMKATPTFVAEQPETVTHTAAQFVTELETATVQSLTVEPQVIQAATVQTATVAETKPKTIQPKFRTKKRRKMGVATIMSSSNQSSGENSPAVGGGGDGVQFDLPVDSPGGRGKGGDKNKKRSQKLKEQAQKSPEKRSSVYSAVRRYHEDKNFMALTKCTDCGALLEEYDDDTISLAIVVLSTFVHRDPELAAPLLLEMLQVVGRVASATFYPWQSESIGCPPGHCCTVAKQFLRCTLHQLAPNGVFPQLFLSKIEDQTFLPTMASSLQDFNELNPTDAIIHLLEGLNDRRNLPPLRTMLVLMNMANYMDSLPIEGSTAWGNLVPLFDTFFRKLLTSMPENCDVNDLFRIFEVLLRSPATKSLPTLLDPMGKLISFAIVRARFKLTHLLEICTLCNRIFAKEREKQSFARVVTLELVQALKFKTNLPDINLIQLVQFVVMDAGGKMSDFGHMEADIEVEMAMNSTGATDCMRQYISDATEYIGDLHTLTKVKNNLRGGSQNLNEDTLGSQLKAGVAQIVALEFTKANGREGPKAIQRYLPWLYHPPSAVQQGPKEFIDCIAHVRLLSWLLLGSLTHAALCPPSFTNSGLISQPIPLDAGNHIADHIQVILAGFAEQSKASVLHMSSLFHAFILCQLWTMYCEQMACMNTPNSDAHTSATFSIMDFWSRVTPGVLQLLSHSKVLADMVNLHFLSLMEALQECNSSVLAKLFPMWAPILFSYPSKLPGSLQVRLQNCENFPPPSLMKGEVTSYHSTTLLKWLKRLQFKMGQIEIQSSAATQFYTV
ncbi:protein unc-79 homolog [Lytechinus variegatus]|uniref:protein unc-79 homolog n=1 Tax=Lytechinus variegatus TaxID=7654 RepID=UPI001BB22B08|nr:protein unc-79 homolog [Lytechinus variegatus]